MYVKQFRSSEWDSSEQSETGGKCGPIIMFDGYRFIGEKSRSSRVLVQDAIKISRGSVSFSGHFFRRQIR